MEPYEPPGIRFFDRASNRAMLLVTGGPWHGWLCYRHPDGQWVSLRLATVEDVDRMSEAVWNSHRPIPADGPAASPRK